VMLTAPAASELILTWTVAGSANYAFWTRPLRMQDTQTRMVL
jgi:hypothetical protein